MNQATNRTPYGLMTDYEKSFFSKEAKRGNLYKFSDPSALEDKPKWLTTNAPRFGNRLIYRLSILPDIYYYVDGEVKLGVDLPKALEQFKVLRLAKNCEIPVKKKTGAELINHLCCVRNHDDDETLVARVLKVNSGTYRYETDLGAYANAEEVSDAFIDSCPNLKALKTIY